MDHKNTRVHDDDQYLRARPRPGKRAPGGAKPVVLVERLQTGRRRGSPPQISRYCRNRGTMKHAGGNRSYPAAPAPHAARLGECPSAVAFAAKTTASGLIALLIA